LARLSRYWQGNKPPKWNRKMLVWKLEAEKHRKSNYFNKRYLFEYLDMGLIWTGQREYVSQ